MLPYVLQFSAVFARFLFELNRRRVKSCRVDYQKESTTKKKKYIYIYTCICYTSWRLFSSMMYELYEADTPYEWVLEWYIRVSAYQLTFIFLRNFIFKKLRSKHLSSSSSAESFFFLPSKILKLHRIDRTRMQRSTLPKKKKKYSTEKKMLNRSIPIFHDSK